MRPPLFTRLSWLLQDIWELSPLARVRRRIHSLAGERGAKVVAGLAAALLVLIGFLSARTVARAPSGIATPKSAPGVVTVHRRVLQAAGGRRAPSGQIRTVYEHGRTVTRSPALRTVNNVRLVTLPAGDMTSRTRTVAAPVTATETHTSTRLVTVTHPVTVVTTTTVSSVKTVSVPVTVTVTVP